MLDSKTDRNSAEWLALGSDKPSLAGLRKASEFSDRHGHLLVMEVAPGAHQIDDWGIFTGSRRIKLKNPPEPLVFDIKKGEAVYLGNFHTRFLKEGGDFGFPIVSDRHAQDIPLAESKIPSLKARIRSTVLKQGYWVNANDIQYLELMPASQ